MSTLTLDEAAAILKLSRKTMSEQLNSGKLPGVRIGRQWRIDPIALTEMLQGRSGSGTDKAEGSRQIL